MILSDDLADRGIFAGGMKIEEFEIVRRGRDAAFAHFDRAQALGKRLLTVRFLHVSPQLPAFFHGKRTLPV